MDLIHRSSATAGIRGLAAALLAALALILVAAGPSLGAAPSPIRLSLPSVSDRSTAAGEPVTFRVEYRHRGGLDPTSVVVRVGPASYSMELAGTGGNVRKGVVYEAVARPPAGKLDVRFEAVDPEGGVGWLDDGWITVTAPPTPPPTPAPTPTPTPAPTPTPTPDPTTPPAAAPPPAAPGAGDGPGGTDPGGIDPTAGPGPTPDGATAGPPLDRFGELRDPGLPAAGTVGGGVAAPLDGRGDASDPSGSAAPAKDPRPIADRPGRDPRPGGEGRGLPSELLAADPVVSVVVSAVGGAAMITAFLLFGRRRSEDEDDLPDGRAVTGAADAQLAAGAMAVETWPTRGPDRESDIPRWRRPSLLEARKHDPARAPEPEPAPRLTFEAAAVDVDDALERRRIRYRVVRLLDSPDELTASEIGLLDEGDEVALCERSGSYWLVLCPDGSRGWVHRMVLGDVVPSDAGGARPEESRSDEELLEPGLAARLTAVRPTPAWTYAMPATDTGAGNVDPERIDSDVLAAYRAARARP